MKERALGRFARVRHFKARAGLDSDSAKHRFCARGQNRSGASLPGAENAPADFAQSGRFCRANPANSSTLIQRRIKIIPDFRGFLWFTATQIKVNKGKCTHCLQQRQWWQFEISRAAHSARRPAASAGPPPLRAHSAQEGEVPVAGSAPLGARRQRKAEGYKRKKGRLAAALFPYGLAGPV